MKPYLCKTCGETNEENFTRNNKSTCYECMKINGRNKYHEKLNIILSKEECELEALKYKNLTDFYGNSPKHYKFAKQNKFIDDITTHMPSRPNLFWTKERCSEEIIKYKTKGELREHNSSCYKVMVKNNWFYELAPHMIINSITIWTKELCRIEALKYTTRNSLSRHSSGAYQKMVTNGWLNELCSHMVKKPIKWTKERCSEEASKYSTKTEFRIGCYFGYRMAIKYNIMTELFPDIIKHTFTKEECQIEASKYKNKTEFYKKNSYLYKISEKNNWLNEFYITYTFTKEECQIEASKYTKRSDFKKQSKPYYYVASKNGWLSEIYGNLTFTRKRYDYSKEECQIEALKYKTRKEFYNNAISYYRVAYRKGFFNDICSHMEYIIKPSENRTKTPKKRGYWTKELCQIEALKYKTRGEFYNKGCGAYSASLKNNWLDELCKHMSVELNYKERLIYIYEFPDNHAYIGLTHNIKIRHSAHQRDKKSSVFKHIKKTGLTPKLIIGDYMDINSASISEGEKLDEYKTNGWVILNKVKTGSLGGVVLTYTKKDCREKILQFKTIERLRKYEKNIYNALIRHGWLDGFKHLFISKDEYVNLISKFWSIELCAEEALKYNNLKTFEEKNNDCYLVALKYNWLNGITQHFKVNKPKKNNLSEQWSFEDCLFIALNFDSKIKFKEHNLKLFKYINKNGWEKEIFAHLDIPKPKKNKVIKTIVVKKIKPIRDKNIKPPGYWTKERCFIEFNKYSSLNQLGIHVNGAYKAIYRNRWHVEFHNNRITQL